MTKRGHITISCCEHRYSVPSLQVFLFKGICLCEECIIKGTINATNFDLDLETVMELVTTVDRFKYRRIVKEVSPLYRNFFDKDYHKMLVEYNR